MSAPAQAQADALERLESILAAQGSGESILAAWREAGRPGSNGRPWSAPS